MNLDNAERVTSTSGSSGTTLQDTLKHLIKPYLGYFGKITNHRFLDKNDDSNGNQ